MKKPLLIITKLLITALVFAWVIHKLGPSGLSNLRTYVQTARLDILSLALGVLLFAMLLGIYRWQCLLHVQGIHLSYYQTAWIWAIGMFFNAFLIGATGGDILKAWYAAEAAPNQKPQAVLSIAVDRLIGLMGLFLLASTLVTINYRILLSHEKTRPLVILILGSLFGTFVAVGLTTQRHRITSQSWWDRIWRLMPCKNILIKLSESYNVYGKHPRTIVITLLLSIGVHLLVVLSALLVGEAIGVTGMSMNHYFTYCPMINAFAAMPITIGGLGLREEAFKFFFSMQGVPDSQSVALSLLFYAGSLVISLIAGIFYLVGKPKSLFRTSP